MGSKYLAAVNVKFCCFQIHLLHPDLALAGTLRIYVCYRDDRPEVKVVTLFSVGANGRILPAMENGRGFSAQIQDSSGQ